MTIKKPITDVEKKIRFNEISELIDRLGKAMIGDNFSIVLKQANTWRYIKEGNIFEYDEGSIYELSDRGVFAKLVDALGMAKFYTNPDPRKVQPFVKEPADLCSMFWDHIGEMWIQEQMIEEHPGTYTILEYMFCKEDAEISGDIEKGLPPHMQYLYALPKIFWKKPISHFDSEVREALEKTEDALFKVCAIPDITKALILSIVEIWDTFHALYKNPPPPPPSSPPSCSSGGPSKQDMDDLIKSSKSMYSLKEKMKEMSEGMDSAGDTKESFGSDVDAEFDARENSDPTGSGAPDEAPEDEILEKAKQTGGVGANPSSGRDGGNRIPYEQLYKEVYHLIYPLKKKLSSIMKDNLYKRMGGNFRSGKLNTKQLFKVAAGSDKVFSRQVHRSHKDYKVTILVDESGSMSSSKKNYYAALGCVLLSEVLAGSGIDFEIIGFNGKIRIYKKFSEKLGQKSRENMERIIPSSQGYGEDSDCGCNDDGYAVNYATHRLRSSSNMGSERMLFVLSDGQPAESGRTLPPEEIERTGRTTTSGRQFDLRTEIELAEQDTYVFGIGINAKHVAQYYNNCAIVDDVEELPDVMLTQLKHMIKRG